MRAGALAAFTGGLWLFRERVLKPAPTPVFARDGRWSGDLPLVSGLLVPVIDATLDGRVVRALVDSGAQTSVVDRDFAEGLGRLGGVSPPVVAVGVSGPPLTGRLAVVDVALGSLDLPRLHVAALDLGALGALRGSGPPVVLVIGQDVLRTVVLDLDQPHGRLAFHDPRAYASPPGAQPAPARLKGGELLVSVEVEGRALEVVLDTGLSSALALSASLATEAGLLAPGRPVRPNRSVTLGAALAGREAVARTLRVGPRTLSDARVAIYARPPASLLPPGLLGAGAFSDMRAGIDLAHGRLDLGGGGLPLTPFPPR